MWTLSILIFFCIYFIKNGQAYYDQFETPCKEPPRKMSSCGMRSQYRYDARLNECLRQIDDYCPGFNRFTLKSECERKCKILQGSQGRPVINKGQGHVTPMVIDFEPFPYSQQSGRQGKPAGNKRGTKRPSRNNRGHHQTQGRHADENTAFATTSPRRPVIIDFEPITRSPKPGRQKRPGNRGRVTPASNFESLHKITKPGRRRGPAGNNRRRVTTTPRVPGSYRGNGRPTPIPKLPVGPQGDFEPIPIPSHDDESHDGSDRGQTRPSPIPKLPVGPQGDFEPVPIQGDDGESIELYSYEEEDGEGSYTY